MYFLSPFLIKCKSHFLAMYKIMLFYYLFIISCKPICIALNEREFLLIQNPCLVASQVIWCCAILCLLSKFCETKWISYVLYDNIKVCFVDTQHLSLCCTALSFDQIHYNIVYVSSTSLLTHITSSLPHQAIPVTLSIHQLATYTLTVAAVVYISEQFDV